MPPAGISGMAPSRRPHPMEDLEHRGNDALEVEARIGEIVDPGRAEVPAGIAGVLDDDRVRQPLPAFPLAKHDLHAAGIRQDRDQRNVRMPGRQVGQVERQSAPTTIASVPLWQARRT